MTRFLSSLNTGCGINHVSDYTLNPHHYLSSWYYYLYERDDLSISMSSTGKFVKNHTIFEQCKYRLQYYVSDFTVSFDMADFFQWQFGFSG